MTNNVNLIGHTDNILINLPKPLIKSGFNLTVLGNSAMKISKTANNFIEILGRNDFEFLNNLKNSQEKILELDGWFLWCSDEITKNLVESDLSDALKEHVLPIKNKKYWGVHGSKANQVLLFQQLRVSHPKSLVVRNDSEFKNVITSLTGSVFIKGDMGGGGFAVKRFESGLEIKESEIPKTWYPITIQEAIDGIEISIEAFYLNGKLICWLYSEMNEFSSPYGPSAARIYKSADDRNLEKELIQIGAALVYDGIVNISMIKSAETAKHHFIEFDSRPNYWSHLYSFFDLNLLDAYQNKTDKVLKPQIAASGIRVYSPDRMLYLLLSQRKLFKALKVSMRLPLRKFGNPIKIDSNLFVIAIKALWLNYLGHPILRMLIRIKKSLPEKLSKKIDGSNIKSKLLKILN